MTLRFAKYYVKMINIIGNYEVGMKKNAFTLAEVLITLGIIGIVAAMTLPSLHNRAQEKQWQVAYKKAYTNMSQAFLRMQANDEFLPMTDLSPSHTGVLGTDAIGENFKIMSKYFKTTHTCFDNNAEECWECANGQSAIGIGPKYLGCQKTSFAFIDFSGMGWYMYSNREWPIIVDVNGNKKPNKLGRDRFVLRFAPTDSGGADSYYIDSADKVIPWNDLEEKQPWCPDGGCFFQSWLLK